MKINKKIIKNAFTLLEILLVVAVISILALIVVIAINPSKQIKETQDSRRAADIRTIHDSLFQYSIDNEGYFPEAIDNTPRMIGTSNEGCNILIDDSIGETASECLDIKDYVAPVYVADIPYDPVVGSPEKTYYAVYRENNRLKVISLLPDNSQNNSSPEEENQNTGFQGSQTWMSANLDINDGLGGIIPYGNNPANVAKYGYLYTWAAANRVANSISGWRLPSDQDWKILEMELGMDEVAANSTSYRGTNEGSKIAGRGDLWIDGPIENDPDFGYSGFDAIPGGLQDSDGWTWVDERNARYWTASEASPTTAWDRYLFYGNTKISRNATGKGAYYSVRLIQE